MGKRALMGAAVTLLAAAHAPAASAQTTFYGCRVPAVGVIYLRAAGADPCLDAAHVQFQWTDGGAPADGSITTVKLADGAVTSAKIADGTIATADLANASVTSAKLAAAPRVALNSSTSSAYLTNSNQDIASVAITVGGAGSILVSATGLLQISGTTCSYVNAGISESSGGAPANIAVVANRPDYGASGVALFLSSTIQTTYLDTVTAAGTYTYYFVANRTDTVAGTCWVGNRGLSAVFIPS